MSRRHHGLDHWAGLRDGEGWLLFALLAFVILSITQARPAAAWQTFESPPQADHAPGQAMQRNDPFVARTPVG